MANMISHHSRSTDPGAAAAERRSGVPVFPASRGRLIAGVGVVVLALTVFFRAGGTGRPGRDAQAASAEEKGKAAEKVTVKRPLPPDVTEDQVPKWVPHRQTSGRTELEPWDSVDAEMARNPYARSDVMAVRERSMLGSGEDYDVIPEEPSAVPEEERLEDEAPPDRAPDEEDDIEEARWPDIEVEEGLGEEPSTSEPGPEDPNEAAG